MPGGENGAGEWSNLKFKRFLSANSELGVRDGRRRETTTAEEKDRPDELARPANRARFYLFSASGWRLND